MQQPGYASTPSAPGAGGVPPAYATTGSSGAPRDYVPSSAEEKAYYDALFQVADTAGSGQIQGLQAVTFFKTSGLDVGVLKHVWALADARQQHFLDREAFYVAMRLIALAQAGQPATTREKLLETLAVPLPYPRFQGIPIQPPPGRLAPLPGATSPGGAGGATANDPYGMTAEERGRYLVHFAPCDVNGDGFVEGAQAVELFSRSGLDRAILGRVWELSDADRDNRLSAAEFAVAMHLIVCVSKRGLPLPPALPPSLRQALALPPTSPAASSPGGATMQPPQRPLSAQLPPSPARPASGSEAAPAAPPLPAPVVPSVPPSPGLAKSVPSLGASSSLGVSVSKGAADGGSEAGMVGEIAQRMKAERVALSATVDAATAENKRLQDGLGKALQEVAALQAELAALRKAAAAADEEGRQALESLGAARKHRELLLQEVEKARAEAERLTERKASLAEELASLKLEAGATKAGAEGLDALAADHRAEAATNKKEVDLIQAILKAQEASKAKLGSEVSALEAQVAQAKGGLAQEHAALGDKKAELAAARQERDATTQERHAVLLRLAGGDLPAATEAVTTAAVAAVASPSPVGGSKGGSGATTSLGVSGGSGSGSGSGSNPATTAPSPSASTSASASAAAFNAQDDSWSSPAKPAEAAAAPPVVLPPAKPPTPKNKKPASFGDDSFTKAAAPSPPSQAPATNANANANAGDDFEFPAPEEGSGADDAFPAPVETTTAATTKAAAPLPPAPAPAAAAPTTTTAAAAGDAFSTDPFGFPDDDFAPAAPSGGSAATAGAPAKGGSAGSSSGAGAFAGAGFDDDFNASAFDKF